MSLDQPRPDTAFGPEGIKGRDQSRRAIANEMDSIRRMKKIDRAINKSMRGNGGGKATERLLRLKAAFGGDPMNISGNEILNVSDIRSQAEANYRKNSESRFNLGNGQLGNGAAPEDAAGNAPQEGGAGVGGNVPQNNQNGATGSQAPQESSTPLSLDQQAQAKSRESALAGNLGSAAQDRTRKDLATEFIANVDMKGLEKDEDFLNRRNELVKSLPPELADYKDEFIKAFNKKDFEAEGEDPFSVKEITNIKEGNNLINAFDYSKSGTIEKPVVKDFSSYEKRSQDEIDRIKSYDDSIADIQERRMNSYNNFKKKPLSEFEANMSQFNKELGGGKIKKEKSQRDFTYGQYGMYSKLSDKKQKASSTDAFDKLKKEALAPRTANSYNQSQTKAVRKIIEAALKTNQPIKEDKELMSNPFFVKELERMESASEIDKSINSYAQNSKGKMPT